MTYSPIQLDIIRTFGSKELSEGCIVRDLYRDSQPIGKYLCDWKYLYEGNIWFIPDNEMTDGWETENIFEILGHIPHLNDLYRVAESKDLIIKIEYNYLKQEYVGITIDNTFGEDDIYALIPYNPTLPLIDQDSKLTLIPLLNLFK